MWYTIPNMRPGPSAETPREQPEVAPDAGADSTTTMLEKLKQDIIALPVKEDDLPGVQVPSGLDRKEVLRQEVNKMYNEIERKIGLAVESGALTKDDAKHMERFLEQKREALAKHDPYFEASTRDNVISRSVGYLRAYAENKAKEGTLITNAVDGAGNFATWSGLSHSLGAATTAALTKASLGAAAGPAGIVAGVVGGIGGSVVLEKLAGGLERVGIPRKVGGLIAKAGAIAAIAALSPASLPIMGSSALVGLVMYGANRAIQKANEEQRKKQALSAMGASVA